MNATPDPVAALAALDDAAIAEAAATGLVAGDFPPSARPVLTRYLEHSAALARALPARDLLRANTMAETLLDRLREDDGDDYLDECADELVMAAAAALESGDTPDEVAAEAAVLLAEHAIAVAVNQLYRGVLKAGRALQS